MRPSPCAYWSSRVGPDPTSREQRGVYVLAFAAACVLPGIGSGGLPRRGFPNRPTDAEDPYRPEKVGDASDGADAIER